MVFLRTPDAEPKKGIRSYRPESESEPQGWKQLRVGGVDGVACQHFQVMCTQLLQKDWEWQEYRRKDIWQGSKNMPPFLTCEAEAYRETFGRTGHPWLDYSSSFT